MSPLRCPRPAVAVFIAVTAAAWAAAVTPAHAAPPWSDPQPVAGAYIAQWSTIGGGLALQAVDGQLGFTPGGVGFTVLGRSAGGLGYARFAGSRGAFGTVTGSSFRSVVPSEMALFGRSGVVLAGQGVAGSDQRAPGGGVPLDAAVTRGNVTGDYPSRQVLARGFVPKPGVLADTKAAVVTALAANQGGDVAAVVSVPVAGKTRAAGFRSRLFVRRRTSGLFRKVMDFGRQTVGSSPSALSLNGAGDVLVAWDDREAVRARMISARGTIGKEQRLGTGGSAFLGSRRTRIAASIDSTRRMLVAWMAQRVGEGNYAGSPGTVAVAAAAPGKPFGGQQIVERNLPKGADRGVLGHGVQVAMLRDRGVVAWTGSVGGTFVVRTADVTSGKVGAPRQLSGAGTASRLQGLVVGPHGGAVIVWVTQTGAAGTPAGHYAAARAAGSSAWGAAETITTTGDTSGLTDAPVAASPVSGEVLVLVNDVIPEGVGVVPSVGPMPVRLSVRAAP